MLGLLNTSTEVFRSCEKVPIQDADLRQCECLGYYRR